MKIATLIIVVALLVLPQPVKADPPSRGVYPPPTTPSSASSVLFYIRESQQARLNRIVSGEKTFLFKRSSSKPLYSPRIINRSLKKHCKCKTKKREAH
jgi:hypothetical protein